MLREELFNQLINLDLVVSNVYQWLDQLHYVVPGNQHHVNNITKIRHILMVQW